MLSPASCSIRAGRGVDARSQNHDPGVSHTTNSPTNRSRGCSPRNIFTVINHSNAPPHHHYHHPGRDEDTSEQKRVLPESMTDASGRIHAPLTQKPDDKNHSGVTAEDEILPGRKDPSIFFKPSETGGRR